MLTEDQIKDLESQHKRIAHVVDKNGQWECVFRAPKRDEYKRFRAMLHDDALKPEATEYLARACVVYPTREGFDALLNDYPALGEACADKIGELAGFTANKMGK